MVVPNCNEESPCNHCIRHGFECSLARANRSQSSHTSAILYGDLPERTSPDMPARGNPLRREDPPRASTEGTEDTCAASILQAKLKEARELIVDVSETLESLRVVPKPSAPTTVSYEDEFANPRVRDGMESLRLFHHYFVSAYSLLSHEPATAELWRSTVPEIALTHEYLMHGVLALSALHYAHTHHAERQQYYVASAHYQQLALRFFSTSVGAINKENCEAYFLLSIIIFLLSTFRIARMGDGVERVSVQTVVQSFVLLQGIRDVLASQSLQRWLVGNPLAVILAPRPMCQPSLGLQTEVQIQLMRVRQLAQEELCFYDGEELQHNYIDSIDQLQTTSVWADPTSPEGRRRIWYWPFNLSPAFLHSLRSGRQLALIILAHFAALVRPLEEKDWVLCGWSSSVLAMIDETLDQRWSHWLDWPRQYTY
ncbi:hypothetical protein GQX73_g6249 [Xylaria multiplex]|uniref:Zn(2)-C6 fungal-type domain-containing protein n=1 Tax=Xylaria multiplex TaxID=323545 RepID=A0A7C8MSJ4_9PEZI|nr:hypothetical protein GQX73_g6249 [Xylaria multiplex]